MNRRTVFLMLAALSLGACATEPVPEGYTGPIAHIKDSSTPRSNASIDFFYLSEIDGREVYDSRSATAQANYGRGFLMEPVVIGRDVPAQPATFTITGRTHYGAPILELFNTVYEISGKTRFAPEPDHSYVVKGELRDGYTAVWVEDSETGELVGEKFEERE